MTRATAADMVARARTRTRSAFPRPTLTHQKEDLDPSKGGDFRDRSAYPERQKDLLVRAFCEDAREGPDEDREEDDRLLGRHRDSRELLVGEGGDPDPRRMDVDAVDR